MAAVEECENLMFEINDFIDFYIIQVSVDGYVDRLYLIFDRVWGVLWLFQDLCGSLAAVDLCLGSSVEVGAELSKCCEFAILSEVQTQGTCDLFHRFDLCGTAYTGYGEADIDSRTDTGVEECGFEVDLTVGDGNNVSRDVCTYVACQSFDDRKSGDRAAAEFFGKTGSTFQQSGVQVEYVAWVSFTSWWTTQQQGHSAVCDSVLGEVIINDEDVFALMHEVFRDGDTGVWCQVLHRGAFGCACVDDDGVVHSASLLQSFVYTNNVGVFLADGYVNTNNVLTLLVQNGIDTDSGFTGTTVTDDKFTLTTADRNHGVDTFETSLQRYIDWLSVSNARCFNFNVAEFGGLDFAFAIDRLAQCIDNTADNSVPYRDLHQTACSLDCVAFLNGFGAPQKNGTYVAFFQVKSHAIYAVRQFKQFAGHAVFEPIDMSDTVADFKNRTNFIDIEVYFVVFNLFFNDRCNFI